MKRRKSCRKASAKGTGCRPAASPIAEARIHARTRRIRLQPLRCSHIGAILRAHRPALVEKAAREMAVVVLR